MTHTHQRTGLRRFLIGSILSVLLAAGITVMAAIYFTNDLVRWTMLGRLCSDDELTRQQAISYVVRNQEDPAVVDGVINMLDEADDECFDTLVSTLSAIGAWGPKVGKAWLRYLEQRVDSGIPIQRASIAVDIARIGWLRGPHHDDPLIATLVEKLLADEDADVRFNALSAAAVLNEPLRRKFISVMVDDPSDAIARHARIMLDLIDHPTRPAPSMPSPESLTAASDIVKRLAQLESMATGSVPLPITSDMPDLIRLQSVRVSTTAEPDDLLRVFESDQPTTRDLACLIALQRFTPEQCRELAKQLAASFVDNQRMAGAILGGMVPPDDDLLRFMHIRAEQGGNWVMAQHYHLGLMLQGESVEGFDPVMLLANQKMPRTTVTMVLMHMGRLEGVDWLLNPLGEPPVALHLLFDQLRYWPVLKQYLPGAPPFSMWVDVDAQKQQLDVIRDWYLIYRPSLRFDPQAHVFNLTESKGNTP